MLHDHSSATIYRLQTQVLLTSLTPLLPLSFLNIKPNFLHQGAGRKVGLGWGWEENEGPVTAVASDHPPR